MATETLRLEITANNKDAITALKQTSSAIGNVGENINPLATKLQNLQKELQRATDPRSIQILQTSINRVTAEVQAQTAEMAKLTAATTATGISFGFATMEARRFQFVLRSIAGIGIFQILTMLGDPLQKLMESFKKISKEEEEAKKKMDGFRESAAKEIVQFQELTTIASDHNATIKERKDAINELRKNYGPYLQGLTDEQILSGKIGDAYTKITEALQAKIALQALEEKVVPIIKQQLELQQKQNELQKITGEGAKALAEEKARLGEKITDADRKYFNESKINARNAAQEYEKNKTVVEELENKIKSLFENMKPFIKASEGLKFGGNSGDKLTELQKILETLNSTINALSALKEDKKISDELFDADKLKAYSTAVSGLEKIYDKLDATGKKTFTELAEKQKELFDAIFKRKMASEDAKENNLGMVEPLEKKDNKGTPKYINGVPQNMDDANKQASNSKLAYNKMLDAEKMKEFNRQFAIADELANKGTYVFDAFFSAIAKGENIGESLGNAFKTLALEIGHAIIKALLLKAIFKALKIGAGVASGGLGAAAVEGAVEGGIDMIPHGANGGIMSGPTSGFLAMLHGTEAVLNGRQMDSLITNSMKLGAAHSFDASMGGIGGGTQRIEVIGKVSGQDIWLSQQRTVFNRGLTV
jgi:DNA repair exonuclease SbcCD ATPase subunit